MADELVSSTVKGEKLYLCGEYTVEEGFPGNVVRRYGGPARSTWELAADAPRDGTIFVFRERHPSTYAISPPMVGRYQDGELQCYTGSRWRPWKGQLETWARIPAV